MDFVRLTKGWAEDIPGKRVLSIRADGKKVGFEGKGELHDGIADTVEIVFHDMSILRFQGTEEKTVVATYQEGGR